MRAVIASTSHELLADIPEITALIAAIESLDSTDEGCLLDAAVSTIGEVRRIELFVSVGPNNKKITLPLSLLTAENIQKICDFITKNRNA